MSCICNACIAFYLLYKTSYSSELTSTSEKRPKAVWLTSAAYFCVTGSARAWQWAIVIYMEVLLSSNSFYMIKRQEFFLLLWTYLYLIYYLCVCVCVSIYRYVHVIVGATETRGSSGTGAASCCLPDVILRTELGTYTRVVCAFRHSVISLDPLFSTEYRIKHTHRYRLTHITDTCTHVCIFQRAWK